MINKVVIFWLWWQWKQFIKFFLNRNYIVYWICKTESTKNIIEKEFWIEVFTDYSIILSNNIDLLVLSAYPIDIYDEIISFSNKFNYKILSDLPITFNIKSLNSYVLNDRIYFFLLETKLYFFSYISSLKLDEIYSIDCLLYQNKDNLISQKFRKESLIVDSHYIFNNLLLLDKNFINLNFKFVSRSIKNIEYIINIKFKSWNKLIYKYEDWKWLFYVFDYLNNLLFYNCEVIKFDNLLEEYISDINLNNNFYKNNYYESFSLLLKKFSYEKNN